MSDPDPWRTPGGLWGSRACGRTGALGDGRCGIDARGQAAPGAPHRCRAWADCVDAQLAGFGYGWRRESIRPHDADREAAAETTDPYVADVLRPDTSLLASFACALEALRFAALLHAPGWAPLLRRRLDGQVETFSPTASTPSLLRWLSRPEPPRQG